MASFLLNWLSYWSIVCFRSSLLLAEPIELLKLVGEPPLLPLRGFPDLLDFKAYMLYLLENEEFCAEILFVFTGLKAAVCI